MENLPSPKRIFIVLIVSGFILYLIYGVNTDTSLFLAIKPGSTHSANKGNRSTAVVRGGSSVKEPKQKDEWKLNFEEISDKQKNLKNSTDDVVLKTSKKERASQVENSKAKRRERTSQVRVDKVKYPKTVTSDPNIQLLLKENSDADDQLTDDKQSRKFLSNVKNKVVIEENKQQAKRFPSAIIIGVKKGGTRALLEILRIHPDIRASGPEIHFFDRDKNYNKGLEWYRDQMPLSRPDQITIEKTPSYFVTAGVPARVYQMSKSVKLVVIVRDPTRRAVSDYAQGLAKHPQNPPFEKMLLKYPNSKQINENWPKVRIGRYVEHYRRWLEYFPPEQFHFVSGEEIVHNPVPEVKALEKFLKIRGLIKEKNFYFNKSKGFPCFVGKLTSKGIKSEPHCLGSDKGRRHPPVRKSVLNLLQDYFRPFNEKFYDMVKRNFHWP